MKKIDARFLDVGTSSTQIPQNKDLGSAAYEDVGTGPEQLIQNKNLFSNIIPGTVSTSTSGTSGSSAYASPADHNHNLGTHDHNDLTKGGQLDHGSALIGLGDDDHQQYILTDGTRKFSGIPSCESTPTDIDHLVNKAYADGLIASSDAMVFKGVIDCSTNPNYPIANCGDTYKVSVAGKIGGILGKTVEIGTLCMCTSDTTASGDQATVGDKWVVVAGGLTAASGFNIVRKTSNYIALNLDLIEADVTAGPITITAPASGMFTVVDIVKLAATNNIIISRTAGIKIDGVDENYIIDVDGGDVFFVYDATASNWFVRKESGSPVDIDFSSVIATTKRNVLIFG